MAFAEKKNKKPTNPRHRPRLEEHNPSLKSHHICYGHHFSLVFNKAQTVGLLDPHLEVTPNSKIREQSFGNDTCSGVEREVRPDMTPRGRSLYCFFFKYCSIYIYDIRTKMCGNQCSPLSSSLLDSKRLNVLRFIDLQFVSLSTGSLLQSFFSTRSRFKIPNMNRRRKEEKKNIALHLNPFNGHWGAVANPSTRQVGVKVK